MVDLLVVENGVIARILKDAVIKASVPALNRSFAKPVKPSCRPCDKKKPGLDYNMAKRVLVSLSAAHLDIVKSRMGANRLKVTYKDAGKANITSIR